MLSECFSTKKAWQEQTLNIEENNTKQNKKQTSKNIQKTLKNLKILPVKETRRSHRSKWNSSPESHFFEEVNCWVDKLKQSNSQLNTIWAPWLPAPRSAWWLRSAGPPDHGAATPAWPLGSENPATTICKNRLVPWEYPESSWIPRIYNNIH